jgi:hypothetical protein
MRRSSSILKKHRLEERVYIASDARDNQYILAEIPLTDELINRVVGNIDSSLEKPYQKFYQAIGYKIFQVVESHGLTHVNFVANNKLVRVRYSGEQQVLHTDQQSFFFYCPEHNHTVKAYFDGAVKARKLKILFLSTGTELRANAAKFHQKVLDAVKAISKELQLPAGEIKFRDHQHLTFDAFAQEKGQKKSVTHTFRDISVRYNSQGFELDKDHTSITYAIASLPLARRLLKNINIDYQADEPFADVYQRIEAAFKQACEDNEINQAALIGNGVSPFVRYDETETANTEGELIHIGVNPNNPDSRYCVHWDGSKLVDTIRFVYFADKTDESHKNYGRFVNQVIQAINSFADEVNWKREADDIMLRIHQHVALKV